MSKKTRTLENFALVSQIGITMLVPILIGLYIGKWLDMKLNTAPIFLLLFIVIGIISAFMNLFHLVKKNFKTKQRK